MACVSRDSCLWWPPEKKASPGGAETRLLGRAGGRFDERLTVAPYDAVFAGTSEAAGWSGVLSLVSLERSGGARGRGALEGYTRSSKGSLEWLEGKPSIRFSVPVGLCVTIDGRATVEGSYSICTDAADEEGSEAVGVEGREGYDWRRSTYAVDTSIHSNEATKK